MDLLRCNHTIRQGTCIREVDSLQGTHLMSGEPFLNFSFTVNRVEMIGTQRDVGK
jgi:hypothetical protein